MKQFVFSTLTKILKLCLYILALNLVTFLSINNATAFPSPHTAPASAQENYLKADIINYDHTTDNYTAHGHVEILNDGKLLTADEVRYDRKNDVVKAIGNVVLKEPDGNDYYGNELELTDHMKHGVIDQFFAKLVDGAILNAKYAKRISEDIFELEDASYSPCKVEDFRTDIPQWRLRASKVKLDRDEQVIKYRNVFLDFGGVPVFYSPYISHPTPNADRKSGLLTPTYALSSQVGTVLNLPYYFNIAPEMDFTLTTKLTSREGPLLFGEFRHLLPFGRYEVKASITNPDNWRRENGVAVEGRKLRSHIDAFGKFDLGNNWYSHFDIKRSSDDTYLRTYNFSEENYLVSDLFFDNVNHRNISTIEAYSFQGLLPDEAPGATPLVLPVVNSHIETDRYIGGSYFEFDNNYFMLFRDVGVQSRRLSSNITYKLPKRFEWGLDMTIAANLRGDLYEVEHVPDHHYPGDPLYNFTGKVGRVLPGIKLDAAYPLIHKGSYGNILLEPMVSVAYNLPGGNPQKIPNEDSFIIELSDDNLFNTNRYAGLDRVESGFRTAYGLNTTLYNAKGGNINFLLGQVYRNRKSSEYQPGSGLDGMFSDFVGRVSIRPNEKIDLAYRFRADQSHYSINRSELAANLFFAPVSLTSTYALINDPDPQNSIRIPKREEIAGDINYDINERWSVGIKGRRNLAGNGRMINSGGRIDYHSDCVRIILLYDKDHTRDANFRTNETYLLMIDLKNLLSLSTNI